MIHAFNNIMRTEEEDLHNIFPDFDKVNKGSMVDFRILKGWLSELDKNSLKNLINVVNQTYFSWSFKSRKYSNYHIRSIDFF